MADPCHFESRTITTCLNTQQDVMVGAFEFLLVSFRVRGNEAQIAMVSTAIIYILSYRHTGPPQLPPRRCPPPLVFHESGSTEPADAPVLLPVAEASGWRMAVPYRRWRTLGV